MKFGTLAVGVLVVAAAAACGGAPTPAAQSGPLATLVLVTANPADPATRQLAVRESASDTARPLDVGLVSAWAPCVTHDATRLCFLGRLTPTAPMALYVSSIGAIDVEPCAATVDDLSAPAWLPDGRIVYAAPAEDGSRALFVVAPPTGTSQRITFCGTDVGEATVLKDGRILYVGTSFEDLPEGAPALFTVHPDGSGVALFHSQTGAVRYTRPRQTGDGTVAFLALGETAHACTIDWRAPQAESTRLALPEGTVAVEPLSDGSWAALSRPTAEAAPRLTRIAADGAAAALGSGWPAALVDICAAGARPRPQGHLSMVHEDSERGLVLCLDARPEGTGRRGVTVRLRARTAGPTADAIWRSLGDVPLEADGSFFVDVPADTPLWLDVLDASGAVVSATRTPFWVRPDEVRGCVGCHTPSDTTPPNRRPQAALRDPLELTGSDRIGGAR